MSGGTFALMSKKREKETKLKELRESFRKADKDGDGALSQDEWIQIMKDNGLELTREEMSQLFVERDRDFDGKLSFEEFSGQETKLERAFKALDKDGDGFITKSEFRSVCRNLTSEQVELAFSRFDRAGNGKLDYREFCALMNARKMKKAEIVDVATSDPQEQQHLDRRSRTNSEGNAGTLHQDDPQPRRLKKSHVSQDGGGPSGKNTSNATKLGINAKQQSHDDKT